MAAVTWVRQWLRRREDQQYHNLIAELYKEYQVIFTSFMQKSPELYTEIEC